jgi:hypothetical protein
MKDIKGLAKKVLRYTWIPLFIVLGHDIYQSEKQYAPERKAITEYVRYVGSCQQKDKSKLSIKEINAMWEKQDELRQVAENAIASVDSSVDKTTLLKYLRYGIN